MQRKLDSRGKNAPFNVAVLGQGTVGSEVVSGLLSKQEYLSNQAGVPIALSAIHRRDPKKAGDLYWRSPELFQSIDDIVKNPEISVVCELMGNIEAARRAIRGALENKKHVVSANKALIAEEWPPLLRLAEENNVQVRFEAAVAGGIPILGALAAGSPGERIKRVRGIINGTTNYILDAMAENGQSYEAALDGAVDKGYAEKSSIDLDVLGRDASQKLSLLIAHAFGKHIPPEQINTRGIKDVTAKDMEHAKSMGLVIKLIARAELVNGKIVARVGPEMVVAKSPLGEVPANFNAIEVQSDLNAVGNVYRGEGAGGKPTAASVLSDIVNIARNRKHGYISPFGRPVEEARNEVDQRQHTFYVRFVIHDRVGVIHRITEVLEKYGINLNGVVQLPYDEKEQDALPFFITVEGTTEANIKRALDEIKAMDFNAEDPYCMPFEKDDLWKRTHENPSSK
jgi:homoserine dehydrogenase